MKDITRLFIVALIATLWMNTADATPIKWTLEDVEIGAGFTAGGSFIYDADSDVYSSIGIETSSGHTYAYGIPHMSDPNIMWASESEGDLTGVWVFVLGFTEDLTNAGGVVELEVFVEGM